MSDLSLDFDEGIIIETEGVHRSGNGGNSYLKKMLLTNKNIIYVTSQKSGGMFSKSVDVVNKIPLSEVKVINGQVFVNQKKTDLFEYALQIQFVTGTEEYSYSEGSKKITSQWVNELNRLLGDGQPVQASSTPKKNFFGGLSGLASSVGTMAGTLGQSVSSAAKQAADQAGITYENARAQMEAKNQERAQAGNTFQQASIPQQRAQQSGGFCVNCGTQLTPGAKFCPGCGAPIGTSVASAPTPPPVPTTPVSNPETRQQEFAGVIVKCPNCGQPISNTDVVCPSCGHQITGRAASSSVQRLQDQLMAVEYSRQQKTAFGSLVQSFTGSDDEESAISSKKVTLIKSFPIPNTIEEIAEFVILAAGSIDVNLSKVSLGNKWGRAGNDFKANERGISDAWVGKLQQAYQKAELTFSDKPIFGKIKEIYTEKMTELNMLKKK
ncbi:MAG: zinc-ribbon domain-containing protein [Catonella sp.]|nr:zinc-ribbon domain-containing protein [Catonella sp.]